MARKGKSRLRARKAVPVEARPGTQPGRTLRCKLHGHSDTVNRIVWSPDGSRLASASYDSTIRIWDIAESDDSLVLAGHEDWVYSATWSPDGQFLASASADNTIRLWSVHTGKQIRKIRLDNPATSVAWSPDSHTLASGSGYDLDPFLLAQEDGGRNSREIYDETTLLWDAKTGKQVRTLIGHHDGVKCACWSPNGRLLATGALDGEICIWSASSGDLVHALLGHSDSINDLSWSSDGAVLASASSDTTIRIWDVNTGTTSNILEGHTSEVGSVAFSFDSMLLASREAFTRDGTIRLWECTSWKTIDVIPYDGSNGWTSSLAFHPRKHLLAALDDHDRQIAIWEFDLDKLPGHIAVPVLYASAKVVLVGESNVGKSCLAMRLVKDEFPRTGMATTHGIRFWQMRPEQLDPAARTPEQQRRDIVLWDFGGQDEYRLVHQLFLHDSTLALVLFDPTRGRTAYLEVEEWSKRLERQFKGRPAIKFLVGAKVDHSSGIVDVAALERLKKTCGFSAYYETSALLGRGISELKAGICAALDWNHLATTSRPGLFQRIRDEIDQIRQAGQLVVPLSGLEERIRQIEPTAFSKSAVNAVVEQLAAQGVIADTRLGPKQRALVLRIEEIERYAGSLILAARNNPHGVPALEERSLASEALPLPGMDPGHRLPRTQEQVVLECVVELLIEHGICFRFGGLLVFPTLFPEPEEPATAPIGHSVSLYYDFTGAIDSIYASLVAHLVMSGKFGNHRLLADRVEFDDAGQGLCGIQRVKRSGGLAHVDLFFAEDTEQAQRRLFVSFVEDHLRRQGVDVREHQAIKCRECAYQLSEEIVQENVARGRSDVICPKCRTVTLISEGIDTIREFDGSSRRKIVALRTEIAKRVAMDVRAIKSLVAEAEASPITAPGIRILHLSDLHFDGTGSPETAARWLVDDIRKGECLGFDAIEYLVVTGDIADKGCEEGWEHARQFVSLLIAELRLSAQRCIFVPGNHDAEDRRASYDWCEKMAGTEPGRCVQEGNIFLVRNEHQYPNRFKKFSDNFFHKVTLRPYSLDFQEQGISYLFADSQIQFITLNSAWEVDQFFRKRSGIHPDALARAITEANRQLREAVEGGRLASDAKILRFGVWHHALRGPNREEMANIDFVEHLQNNGVKVCLHGDVHEMHRDHLGYWHEKGVHVVGAGSFGAPTDGRPESTPRQYNILEIRSDRSCIRVHTRAQKRINGAWKGWYEWPNPDGSVSKVPYYDIQVS